MSERAKTFDALYRANDDPWEFRTSAYERRKYAATLDALGRARYGRVLEIGCSIGVMTGALALRCDELLALDVSEVALAHARRNCTDARVRFRRAEVPSGWPRASFDLIVLSEVLYFLSGDEVAECAERCAATLRPAAEVLLVNWTGATTTPLSGREAASVFVERIREFGIRPLAVSERETYRIDRLGGPPPGPSTTAV